MRRALSSDEFLRRAQPASSDGGKRRQVVPSPSASLPMVASTSGTGTAGVLSPRVPRSQLALPTNHQQPTRSKSRPSRSRTSPRPQHSPSLSLPSLPPSPALLPSLPPPQTATSAPPAPPLPVPSVSLPPTAAAACPEPRGSTIWQPAKPDSPAVTGVAVLRGGELLNVPYSAGSRDERELSREREYELQQRDEDWGLPTPYGSPTEDAYGGAGGYLYAQPFHPAPAHLPGGGGVRRCISASPPTTASLLPPASYLSRPSLPRGRESAPSSTGYTGLSAGSNPPLSGNNSGGGKGRARGSSNTSMGSTSNSASNRAPPRRRRVAGNGSISSTQARTPLSSSPAREEERPVLQTYTSFEEQFGLCAPPSPPLSPSLVGGGEGGEGGEEGEGQKSGGRWWQL